MSHRRLKAASICCIVCVTAGAAATLGATRRDPAAVPSGVSVAGMPWGGKTRAAARDSLLGWMKRAGDHAVVLSAALPNAAAREWSAPCAKLGLTVDVDRTVGAALAVGQDEGLYQRVVGLVSGRRPVTVPVAWRFDEAAAKRYLANAVLPSIRRPAKDARYLVRGGGAQVVPEQSGLDVDMKAALDAIRATDPQSGAEVALPLKVVQPRITSSQLAGIEGEVSSFSTHYSERGNRARNIEVACRHIDGTVLLPGDVFSYNAVVGPRESEAGFRMAPVIIRGKLEDGMGGGVCQVSTTLYNAALLADLEIVSRTHHAFPVHYVSPGRDATVAYGSIDFRFKNNTDAPIAVAADGSGGRVLMRVFGKRVPGREVRLERTGVETIDAPVKTTVDPKLPLGKRVLVDPGRSGHRARLWRVVKVNGQLSKREMISSDSYSAFTRIVTVSPGFGRSRTPRPAGQPVAPGSGGAPAPAPSASGASATAPASAGGTGM